MSKEFTDGNFKEEVLDNEGLSVVDFWAEWCGPCRKMTPIIDELSDEMDGKVKIGKVNVDENQEISLKYGIRSIPTILFIKGGEVVDKLVGTSSKDFLKEKIETLA